MWCTIITVQLRTMAQKRHKSELKSLVDAITKLMRENREIKLIILHKYWFLLFFTRKTQKNAHGRRLVGSRQKLCSHFGAISLLDATTVRYAAVNSCAPSTYIFTFAIDCFINNRIGRLVVFLWSS